VEETWPAAAAAHGGHEREPSHSSVVPWLDSLLYQTVVQFTELNDDIAGLLCRGGFLYSRKPAGDSTKN
jgi:hypothetical protein